MPWLEVPESHPGVHAVGRPWLIHRASGTLHGMPAAAARVAAAITDGARGRCGNPPLAATE